MQSHGLRSWRGSLLLALAGLAAASLLAAPAAAHPKAKHKHKKAKASYDVIHFDAKGGPPPWAPAHGYRRKQGQVYVAPFGIDLRTCNRELLGAALGGAAGGLLASEIAKGDERPLAIAGGAILGVLVGGSIGRSMDRLDHHCVGQILEHAPANAPVAWQNPDNQRAYSVTAVRTYEDAESRYCREYQTTATIAEQRQQSYGVACRQPDGSWQIVN